MRVAPLIPLWAVAAFFGVEHFAVTRLLSAFVVGMLLLLQPCLPMWQTRRCVPAAPAPATPVGKGDGTMSDLLQELGTETPQTHPRRQATVSRNTLETGIRLNLAVDGTGRYDVSTGIRFFDHMLESFAKHGGFDLELRCKGDLDVDQHHTVEDVGIALGEAFGEALGDKRGILRAGYFVMAMDETLAVCAVDLSGRVSCVVNDELTQTLVGDFQTELVPDFFDGFARGAKANVHVKTMYGRSNHHNIEAIFKAFARAMRGACSRDERMRDLLPSTKGLL